MGSERIATTARPDGVDTFPADLNEYRAAREQLGRFGVPVLADGPHGRLWVACFDGTWNDREQFPEGKTNVAGIFEQIVAREKTGPQTVSAGYQPGVGTQRDEIVKTLDGALGYSYGPRMEEMYLDFIVQSRRWLTEDPNAEISLASVGFSRGGPTAAMFTRMVHERGIQDPVGMKIERDAQGNILRLTPTRPDLVPPGQTRQALGLFDPVATGVMDHVDVRPAPSVVTGFQIIATQEHRDLFQLKQIVDPGLSQDGRFFSVMVPAAHSDAGGGYLLNGVSLRNGNMMMAYLNALSDTPFLAERMVPSAPGMNVIHRSEQHQAYYSTVGSGLMGERQATERLVAPPRTALGALGDVLRNTDDAEAVDHRLRNGLRYRAVPVGSEREDPAIPDVLRGHPGPQPIRTLEPVRALPPDPPRTSASEPMPVDHPDWPLFDSIRQRMPGASDAVVAHVALEAKRGHVGSGEVRNLDVIDDVVHVQGRFPGDRASVRLDQGVPPLDVTLRDSRAYDVEQSRQLAQQQVDDPARVAAQARSIV